MTLSNRGPMPDFPVLDESRTDRNDYCRTIFDTFGFVEPYTGTTDSWVSMPLRLVHDTAAGWHLELGPYDLNAADILALRQAIAAYDDAGARPLGEPA